MRTAWWSALALLPAAALLPGPANIRPLLPAAALLPGPANMRPPSRRCAETPPGRDGARWQPPKQKKRGPFETEFGAFIYDKGYRQLFRALGYPGADAEAALALERLNEPPSGEARASRVLLDVSCGPGIITTRIAAGLRGYDALVAARSGGPFGFGPAIAAGALLVVLVPHRPLLVGLGS